MTWKENAEILSWTQENNNLQIKPALITFSGTEGEIGFADHSAKKLTDMA